MILCGSMWFLDNSTSPDVSRCIPDNLVWIAAWDLNLRLRLGRGHPGICPSDRSKSTRPRGRVRIPTYMASLHPKTRNETSWNHMKSPWYDSKEFKMNDSENIYWPCLPTPGPLQTVEGPFWTSVADVIQLGTKPWTMPSWWSQSITAYHVGWTDDVRGRVELQPESQKG